MRLGVPRPPARIALGLCAPLAVACHRAPDRAPGLEKPNAVVLVTLDTLRADHLGCYGYFRATSPFLDRLAREGLLFDNAFSAVSQTSPAHASLFSGLYPAQHRIARNGMGFPPLAPRSAGTLAEAFAGAGYDTAAFMAVRFLAPVARGFRHVDAQGLWRHYRQADETVDRALAWLGHKRPADRFLLWIHLFDPHRPYRAPRAERERLALETPAEVEAFARRVVAEHRLAPGFYATPGALAAQYGEYDAEVAFADRQLARLFEAMAARGFHERALWIVTADHGEGLGSHGYKGHGRHIYREQLHVPLILWGPGVPAGRRTSELVRHVDLLPTLLELLGVQARWRPRLPGRSLVPLLREPERRLPRVLAFAQRRPPDPGWEQGDVFTVFDRDWKYIVHSQGRDEFFDLRSDPHELNNLASRVSAVKDALARTSREMLTRFNDEGREAEVRPVDPGLRDELRALGYVR